MIYEFPVSVEKLASQACNNPYGGHPLLWGLDKSITPDEVRSCVAHGLLEDEAYDPLQRQSRTYHIRRVAWLVANGWGDAIIDASDPERGVTVEDGYHRLAAAIVRADQEILVCPMTESVSLDAVSAVLP